MHVPGAQPLVPAQALAAFLDEHAPWAPGGPLEVARVGQGKSNLTFRVRRGGRSFILRRPPRGELPETAHDMMREYRVLAALADTPVRAPRPLAACADPSLLGVPFYLMEVVEGIVIRDRLPEEFAPADRAGIGHEAVDALAELHRLDYAAVGLGGLGRGEGYTARQVRRWSRQWEIAATREIADISAVRAWLEAQVPPGGPVCVVHGDYKLDNVVFAPGPPAALRAILDWEMATLGDPLADLGYLMVFWPEPGEEDVTGLAQPTRLEGSCSRAELVARYEQRTGSPVGDLAYHRTLALWKLAILLEGLYKRYLAGQADSDWFAVLEHTVPQMARTARSWCDA